MPTARQKAAAQMGRAKTPAKVAAARENAKKAVAARMAQPPEQRQAQARKAGLAAALRRAQKAAGKG
jgi:hypothetical protein